MMKVNTIRAEGLVREFEVTIPAADIQRRIEDRLRDVGRNVKLKGFRKGRIPRRILDHRYGSSVRGEILEQAVNQTCWKLLREEHIRPATKPRIDVAGFEEGMDLVYTMHVESMPEMDISDLDGVALTRRVAKPEPEWLEQQLQQLRQSYAAANETGEDSDTGLARSLGAGSFEELRDVLQKEQQRELDGLSRQDLKRQLFDYIDRARAFQLPPGMSGLVDLEYDSIKLQVELEQGATGEPLELTAEEKSEIREIAERRVRLGMVVAELGHRLNLKVSRQELQNAVKAEARRYPGQEQQVLDHFANQPMAMDSMRASVLEDKVTDHILASANITDQEVSPAELRANLDPQEDGIS